MRLNETTVLGKISEIELLRLAASVESSTRHPLAESVTNAAKRKGISFSESRNSNTEPGSGVYATVDGKEVIYIHEVLLNI